MGKFSKKREKLVQQAEDYLKNTLYVQNSDDCQPYFIVDVSAYNRKKNYEDYQKDLAMFKTLFNADNEDFKTVIWNDAVSFLYKEKLCREDFTKDEYAFLQQAIKASKVDWSDVDCNAPIVTDRLVLRTYAKKDVKLFKYHYKNDGDFVMYGGLYPSNANVNDSVKRFYPLYFTIEEKTSRNVVGYVGLLIRDDFNTALLEYYIFKEYRQNGYCKEAVSALTDMALDNRLYFPEETIRKGVYGRKIEKIQTVRARIATINEPSIRTILSCGFSLEATLHKTMHKYGMGWIDENVYYLSK